MKAIIDGKRYNTDTATEVAAYWNGCGEGDFNRVNEKLYKTAKGAWFIAGSGGARSSYSQSYGDGVSGGEAIRPITADEAIEWLESHNEADALDEHFAEHIEDA